MGYAHQLRHRMLLNRHVLEQGQRQLLRQRAGTPAPSLTRGSGRSASSSEPPVYKFIR